MRFIGKSANVYYFRQISSLMTVNGQFMNRMIVDLEKLGQMLNSTNHETRCHALNLFEQKTDKLRAMESEISLIRFQMIYFKRRGKEPTAERTARLCKGLHRLGGLLISNRHRQRNTIVRFIQLWRLHTFGTKQAITKVFKKKINLDMKRRDKMMSLCSYKNQCRLNMVTFEAFQKWKLMIKLNYPLIPKRKEMGHVLPYSVLHRKNQELHKRYKLQLDQVGFYRIISVLFYTLKRKVDHQKSHFFMKAGLKSFLHASENGALIRKKCTLTANDIRYELMIPAIFAMQTLKNGYKRRLLGSYLRLASQVKLIEMRDRVKKAKLEWMEFQQRARAELLMKILVRTLKLEVLRYFYKWKLQSRLRRATLNILKEVNFERKQATADFKEYRKNHRKIDELLKDLSARYVVKISKQVIKNIKAPSSEIKDHIDSEFAACIEDMLNEL